MEEKKETQEKKPPVPPVKKSKPTTSTKRTVKATVKKPIQCKLCQVPNHTNLYYSVEKGSAEVKFFREVKPRKPRKAKETGEQMETKSSENVQSEQKATEEKKNPPAIREKIIEEREMADKVAQYIASKTASNNNEENPKDDDSKGNDANKDKQEESKQEESKQEGSKKEESKKEESKKEESKKDEPKKKVLNINKHLVRFLGLLCATGAFFLVNPVLMFVALMLFEASFIMQSIEYNEFRPKRPPMSRREKNMEKIAKYEKILAENQLSNEEISLYEQGHSIKGRRNRKKQLGEDTYKSYKAVSKKRTKFDKTSKKLNKNIFMIKSAEDFAKEQEFIQSMNSHNNKFEQAKQSYLDKVQRYIDACKQMVEQIETKKIKVDKSQLAIINDEIKSCQEYLDSVSSLVINSDYIQNKNYLDCYHRSMNPSFLDKVRTGVTFESSMEEQKYKLKKPTLNKEAFESLQASIEAGKKQTQVKRAQVKRAQVKGAQDKAQVKEAEQKQNSNDEEITK